MKILIHRKAEIPVKVISSGSEEVILSGSTCIDSLWELAERFPGEVIGWCEEEIQKKLAFENWEEIFFNDLVMASYAVKTTFLPASIGYVDQLPFINIDKRVSYGTWLMSSDVGGVKGEVLKRFKDTLSDIPSFGYLLNSIAKIGQQNGLFCYSAPALVHASEDDSPKCKAGKDELFRFVYQHYTSVWTTLLLLCFLVYEKSFPLISYFRSFFNSKYFRKNIDLTGFIEVTKSNNYTSESIDVIIPTIGRANYLHDVLKDFSSQTHLPSKIIIVEQNPDLASVSELDFIKDEKWPFKIIHRFIHRTGACNARNIALNELDSEWVFFADDDIRFGRTLLESVFSEIKKYNICAINMNCRQPGEETIFGKIKQWGSFGSGTSVVRSFYAKQCRFSPIFEHGHGEDTDFGMQLRREGCDIIYHPGLEITHLKAPIGGLREKATLYWEAEKPLPKPSPTVMAYALRNYTQQQIRGYKISLFIKFYPRQKIKNPFSYIPLMNKRWKKSMDWAQKLIEQERND